MNEDYLTVTALTKYIKYKFDHDRHLRNILLKGEISNFKRHSRGHFYLTLKDENTQIRAIMFASNANNVVFTPEDGMTILVEGYVSVYEVSGSYQLYITSMTEDGLGNLYLAYEELKKKLQKEGLFREDQKQQIPTYPKTIGVLTSPTGAAVRDIIHTVNRRFPLSNIIVYPTLVQGEHAKENIVNNIKQANKQGLVDVIILGRGGGSIEDLWPFNEEEVAYAIYTSTIPIISSVGHETDFTISDFVADLRAPTPTGGAELAVPNQIDLLDTLAKYNSQMQRAVSRLLIKKSDQLTRVKESNVFRDPTRLFQQKQQQLIHLDNTLRLLSPKKRVEQAKEQIKQLQKELYRGFRQVLHQKQHRFETQIQALEYQNPLSIMKKGYSVIKQNGTIKKSIEDIAVDSTLEIQLHDGYIDAVVNDIRKDKS